MTGAATEDHRTRTARERRARMTSRLQRAAVECHAADPAGGLPTVDRVVEHAGVTRQTFYKYYASIDAAIEASADRLVADMVDELRARLPEGEPPLLLFAASLRLFLLRGADDPAWGAFVARGNMLDARSPLFTGMRGHLREARAAGRLSFEDIGAAVTLVVGAMRECLRLASAPGAGPAPEVDAISRMILRSLGLPEAEAAGVLNGARALAARRGSI